MIYTHFIGATENLTFPSAPMQVFRGSAPTPVILDYDTGTLASISPVSLFDPSSMQSLDINLGGGGLGSAVIDPGLFAAEIGGIATPFSGPSTPTHPGLSAMWTVDSIGSDDEVVWGYWQTLYQGSGLSDRGCVDRV